MTERIHRFRLPGGFVVCVIWGRMERKRGKR
jgi:hypothetical protein